MPIYFKFIMINVSGASLFHYALYILCSVGKSQGGKGRKCFVWLKKEWTSTQMRVEQWWKGNIRRMSTKQGASKGMCVWVRAAFKSGKVVNPCLHPWVIWRQNNMHYDNPITRQKDNKSVKAAGSWRLTWKHSNRCKHTNNNRENKKKTERKI